VANVPTYEDARKAFDQLSGAQHASAQAALIHNSHFVRDAVTDRIRGAFEGVAAPSMPVLAYGPDETGTDAKDGPFAGRQPAAPSLVVWGTAFGSWGRQDGGSDVGNVDIATGGLLVGADAPAGDAWRIGLLAGYSHSSFDTANSEGEGDSYHLGAYAGAQWDAFSFRSGLSYTWHDIDTARSVAFLGETLKGNYDAGTFLAFGELGYRIDAGAASFEPYANLAHVRLKTDGFTETGGIAALSVDSQTVNTTFTTLGVRFSSAFSLGSVQTVARGGLGWQHAYGDTSPTSTHVFTAGGDAFTVSGVPIAKDVAVLEVGMDLKVAPNATLGISYTGQYGSDARENGFNARLGVKF
jgi:outer membrane autotransporter protein